MPAVVGVLLAIELVDELVFGAREAAWPLIRDDLGLDYVQIGILLSLPLLVANIIEIPLAFLGDTRHRKLIIVAGGGVFIASVLLVGLSGSFWPLLVALLLFSPASGAFVSLAQASLADVDAGRREQNMARWTAAGSLGVLGGVFAIGLVAELDEGWRLVFFAIAALSAIVLTLAAHQPAPRISEKKGKWVSLRMDMRIINLVLENQRAIEEAAALLVAAFADHYPEAWPDLESAVAEVRESFGADRLSLIAVDADEKVVGWIGGISQYDGRVWELHPVVVAPQLQRQGIGRALVEALEARARERGGLTMWLGTDDEDGQTTLSGVDLYDDLLGRLGSIRSLQNHPYEFYERLGYTISGVMPDANGFGKPDIFMAKRIAAAPTN